MMDARKRKGEMRVVTFRIDRDTLAALEELEASMPKVRGRRSIILRKLILDARAR